MIDQTRQKVFLNKYSNKEIIKKLRIFFNKRNIIIACRNYFRTVIKDDKNILLKINLIISKNLILKEEIKLLNF